MFKDTAFAGMNGFIWWTGVVENRMDPLNLGRCQVRMFGWHTDNKTLIPTGDLAWALPMLPTNNSSESKTPLEADWVVGFFMDGASGQFPIIMGVLPGIPTNSSINPTVGFNDPRTPAELAASPIPFGLTEAVPYPRNVGEPSTSRLFRNENIDKTQMGARKNDLDIGIAIARGGEWNEPTPPYATVPPYNDVKESESGHLFEFDDTPGAERVNLSHRKGTYIEMQPDGSRVAKIVADNYEIIAGDNFVHISGACNLTVDGDIMINAPNIVMASQVSIDGSLVVSGGVSVGDGVSGSFTTPMGQTVDVQNGIVTNIF
jgi:phage baseplate assembly protein gpV